MLDLICRNNTIVSQFILNNRLVGRLVILLKDQTKGAVPGVFGLHNIFGPQPPLPQKFSGKSLASNPDHILAPNL